MSRRSLILTAVQRQEMLAEIVSRLPEEACGLLAGRQGRVETVIPIENQLHSATRFVMEPVQQVRAFREIDETGQELLGIFHSHPAGPAGLSHTDLDEFAYPGTIYLIWSPAEDGWQTEAFLIDAGGARKIRLVVE